MTSHPTHAAAAALALLAVAGCGLGEGEPGDGEATLRVTRDYGSELLADAELSDPPASETVIGALDGEAEITTRYGGAFVQSIEGVEGAVEDGRSLDWFFYVNGVESSLGAAEVPVRGGDRIWWDYRDWTEAMRVPAVVGSFPEPFAQAAEAGSPDPAAVECEGERAACDEVTAALRDVGARVEAGASGGGAIRVLVGPWDALRSDPAAALLRAGPARSGVFARFEGPPRAAELVLLDEAGEEASRLGPAGLVAAVRPDEDAPVWLVAGTGDEGVEAAAQALGEETLRDRYAVAATAARVIGVPVLP